MGISSNQARFLTLTGRKCDIEYRMQNICQRRLAIANETQRASQLYNDAMSNRKLFINEMSAGSQFGGLTQGTDLSTVAELTAPLLNENGYWIVDTENPNGYKFFNSTVVGIGAIRTAASLGADEYPTIGHNVTINNVTYKVGSVNSYQTATRPNITDFSQPDNTFNRTVYFAAGTTGNTVPASGISYSTPAIPSINSTTGIKTYSYSATETVDHSAIQKKFFTESGATSTVDLDEYVPTFFAADTSDLIVDDPLKGESLDGMASVIESCVAEYAINSDPNNLDLEVVTYQTPVLTGSNEEDGSPIYEMKTINSIKINTQAGFDAVMMLMKKDNEKALAQNYVLGGDFNITAEICGSQNFAGFFDGANHTLNFGTVENSLFNSITGGRVSNLTLRDTTTTTTQAPLLAGSVTDDANISNVKGSLYSIDVSSLSSKGFLVGNVEDSVLDHCNLNFYQVGSATSPEADISVWGMIDQIDSESVISNSHVMPSVLVGDLQGKIELVSGGDEQSKVFNNTYKSGTDPIKNFHSNEVVSVAADTTPVTLNDTTVQEYYTCTEKVINATYEEYPSSYNLINEWTDDNEAHLEEYLRSGRYKLVREADVYTQNPTNFGGKNYEFVDWRNVPIISDALDTSDDAEAQTNYDRTIRDLNEQDKILEMEMQKLDTEYTAVNAERDSLTKILDTNVKGSFKYFS